MIVNGIIDIVVEPYVDFCKKTDCYSFRHNDELPLKKRYARTDILKCSYFYRVVGTRNFLSEYIRRAASVNSFKVLVKKFFYGLVHSFSVLIIITLLP